MKPQKTPNLAARKKQPNPSGVLKLADGLIKYSLPDGRGWELPLSQIKVIGEHTNSDGPHLDDYFFVFVLPDGSWHFASYYANGAESFYLELSSNLGCSLKFGLTKSTSLKSRVMWPKDLEGKDLFNLVPEPPSKNYLIRLGQKISPTVRFELSEPVRKALNL